MPPRPVTGIALLFPFAQYRSLPSVVRNLIEGNVLSLSSGSNSNRASTFSILPLNNTRKWCRWSVLNSCFGVARSEYLPGHLLSYLRFVVRFRSPSRQIPWQHFDQTMTVSSQILFKSSFIYQPATRLFIASLLKVPATNLSPRNQLIVDKTVVTRLLKNFPTLYNTRRFATVFTGVYYWPLSWARWFQLILPHPVYLRSVLILSSYRRPGFFIVSPYWFPVETLYPCLLPVLPISTSFTWPF
jgi:hypothetical protein